MPINMSRIKAIWPWLAEVKYAWLALTVVIIALAVCYLMICLGPYTSEPVIRTTGLVLQLLGVATVIWGISETRALFGHPSFASKTKDWLSRFPLIRRDAVIAVSGVSCAVVGGSATAYVTHGPGESPTIESRVEALEKNITSIHERINETQNQIGVEVQKVSSALKLEEQSRQTEDHAIREKLEATGTGGVHISAIGALWLFVGVILSTASPEIASLCK